MSDGTWENPYSARVAEGTSSISFSIVMDYKTTTLALMFDERGIIVAHEDKYWLVPRDNALRLMGAE